MSLFSLLRNPLCVAEFVRLNLPSGFATPLVDGHEYRAGEEFGAEVHILGCSVAGCPRIEVVLFRTLEEWVRQPWWTNPHLGRFVTQRGLPPPRCVVAGHSIVVREKAVDCRASIATCERCGARDVSWYWRSRPPLRVGP